MALRPLTKRDLAVVGPAPGGGRFKAVRLTDRGQEAQWAFADWIGRLDTGPASASAPGHSGLAGGPGAAGGRPR